MLVWEASAVARAAMETGVAQEPVDLAEYRERLERRMGKAREVVRTLIHKAQMAPKRIVFPEGEHEKVLRAAHIVVDERMAKPILLGSEENIRSKARELGLELDGVTVVDPLTSPLREPYGEELYRLRQRRGLTLPEAQAMIENHNMFGSMMVRQGDADALLCGVTQHYPDTIRPALQVIQLRPDIRRVSALYAMISKKGDIYFLADVAVNIEPTSEELAEIALLTAQEARRFDVVPRVALLSFSNFGSTRHPLCDKVRRAVELVRKADPKLMVDGEMAADVAVMPEMLAEAYPFSTLRGGANVLIFPDLASANVAYKLLMRLGGMEAIGPILMGMSKPVHVLPQGSGVEEIVQTAAIAVVDAQEAEARALAPSARWAVGQSAAD